MNDLSKIKDHLDKYGKVYLGVGIGLGIAGITWVIVRAQPGIRDHLSGQGVDATTLVDNSMSARNSPYSFSNNNYGTVNNIIGVKRLSYIISNPETGEWWRTQSEAARALGLSETRLSSHLNHGAPLEEGLSLVREGVSSNLK